MHMLSLLAMCLSLYAHVVTVSNVFVTHWILTLHRQLQLLEKVIEKGISDADAQARQYMRRLVLGSGVGWLSVRVGGVVECEGGWVLWV